LPVGRCVRFAFFGPSLEGGFNGHLTPVEAAALLAETM
jgi:hypothetical protein